MTTSFELVNRALAKSAERHGDFPVGAVIRGDERCNRPGSFNGPRGWDYWNRLVDPDPHQNLNLSPDTRPTYFWAQLVMPTGSAMKMRGVFPRARLVPAGGQATQGSGRYWRCSACRCGSVPWASW